MYRYYMYRLQAFERFCCLGMLIDHLKSMKRSRIVDRGFEMIVNRSVIVTEI